MYLIDILTFVGLIGLFLYGLKLISEGLQKIMGESLRNLLTLMTKNRFTGMLTGILVAALVQSSSATIVMIVSFVNAGLINLAEALAVIMGANLGTTVTTWIIALLGFRFNLAYLAFPLLAIAWPCAYAKSSRSNSWGEFLIGVSLLFISVDMLKGGLDVSVYPALLDFFHVISSWGYASDLLFVLLGFLVTLLVRSSCVSFALAAWMSLVGMIPLAEGCAFIIGSNVGSCINPLLASRSANAMAKRAALGNLVFNLAGTLLLLVAYPYFIQGFHWLCINLGIGDTADPENAALCLALFHSLFNALIICLLLPFIKQLVKLVSHFVSEDQHTDAPFKLQYISEGIISSSGEMALMQVRKEVSRYCEETYKMFTLINKMLDEPMGSEKQVEMMNQVKSMEKDSDQAELEIAQFLNQISPQTLSYSGELHSRNLYKIVDELESIADSIYHTSVCLLQKCDHRVRFNAEMNQNVRKMMGLTDAAMQHMLKVLAMDNVPGNALDKAYNYEDEINNFRNQLRNEMLDSIDRNEVEFQQNTYFMQIINECEKIGDYIINVIAAATEK